jgi:hypothetical protein
MADSYHGEEERARDAECKTSPIGSVITFRYQELSDGGVPRCVVCRAIANWSTW